MSDDKEINQAFHLKEFELLKSEIKQRTEEQTNTERLVIFSSALIYSLLATLSKEGSGHVIGGVILILWWMPPLLILYGLTRWQTNDDMIHTVGFYIRYRLENVLAKDGIGWESSRRRMGEFRNFIARDRIEDIEQVGRHKILYIARHVRMAILTDEKDQNRPWLIMETIRMLILCVSLLIAILQTAFLLF